MTTIVVLVKNVPDTWSEKVLEPDHTLDRTNIDSIIDEINEYAVETALQIKEAGEHRVVALSMGPEGSDEALRKALAMGADDAVLLSDEALAGSDAVATAWALTNAINTIDDVALIVTGNQSSDGQGGVMAGLLAEYRQIPALTEVGEVSLAGGTVTATRYDDKGTWELEAATPAIIAVSDKAASPRFPNFKGLAAAKKADVTQLNLAAIGVDAGQVGLNNSATVVQTVTEVPTRTAGEIIDSGSPEEIAAQVVDKLAAKNLI
ncbi:electron transfer flavoprotein subunit beta/FixA family protein [Corynebacterium cystitidis]|uniref:Electron transfer flavoprotein subunit beta n=1 Tax=Corynebacterium cystitidis DSM 20524 TaxID=1121357 RepID=A0A1H9S301_9CORY|nr:electron transfer flavoprotein subunit beta/FixA family protein [Corynebacterium cystitidis]WJY82193.1 Electron transfer flavoprotein subunit beta [Corynebacterium cystitidis DSM 20524]SER79402.1 electron transfer flavoprotein beta subunit [Corynebacterium cystitidis DSM 20524]SNV77991.1 electron transfer flavoprotein subunit beta [Corynebacterium cystitidis]